MSISVPPYPASMYKNISGSLENNSTMSGRKMVATANTIHNAAHQTASCFNFYTTTGCLHEAIYSLS